MKKIDLFTQWAPASNREFNETKPMKKSTEKGLLEKDQFDTQWTCQRKDLSHSAT